MDKIADSDQPTLSAPKGQDPERFQIMRQQKAMMKAEITPGGSVIVNCPYCIIYYGEKVPVDVTRFVDQDGTKECVTYCVRREHRLVFRPVAQWREERQKMGLQVES